MPSREAVIDLALAQKQATGFARTNIYVLWRARKELQESFPLEEQGLGRFAASFLKENCVFDAELTRQSRAKRTEAIWAADEYQPGQLVVKRGDLIDTRVKAVLDQLRERLAGEQARTDLSKGQIEAQTVAAQFHEQQARAEVSAQVAAENKRWLVWGIMAALLPLVFVLWRLARRRPSYSLLPANTPHAQITGTVVSCPSCSSAIVLPLELMGPLSSHSALVPGRPSENAQTLADANEQYWKDRALQAESRAQKTNHVLRARLVPHLARWLMNNVVRRLTFQRNNLLDTQQKAEQELAELEQRLLAVQAPLEERLNAYEQRIAELETDLRAKGKENHELIEATIAMAKKKLARERSKERLTRD